MKTHKVALTVGLFAGLMHLVWEVILFFGMGQDILDWKLSMHSLTNPFVVTSFNLGRGIGLIVMSIVVGYIGGWVFAAIYNKIHR